MTRRVVLAALLVLASAAAPGVHALPTATACHVVRDAPNDAFIVPGVPDPKGTGAEALDLRSGDIASDRRDLTVAITVENLGALDVTGSSRTWDFVFDSAEGHTLDFKASWQPSGRTHFVVIELLGSKSTGYVGNEVAPAHGTLDRSQNQIVMTARLAALKPYLADRQGYLGRPLRNFRLEASRQVRTDAIPTGTAYIEDEASSSATFRIGEQNSCIAVRRY